MEDEVQQWLADGIARAKAGEREQARELLLRAVARDERNVQAWLWLSGVVEGIEDRRVALENVLTLDPQNTLAQAGLDWLNRQAAPEPQDKPPIEAQTRDVSAEKEPVAEPEGCPYCGQAVSESDPRCPHCTQPLTIHALKHADFTARVVMLVVAWLVQAVTDLISGAAVVMLMALSGGMLGGLMTMYVHAYLAGAAWKPGLAANLQRMAWVLIVFDIVASAWSLVMAVILPGRRPAALGVALFVAALHVVLAVSGWAVGATSLWVMLARLALALFIGFLVLEAQGDFAWESVRQRLELDRGAKSSMDYYSRGRYYRRLGQTAKAILHWERAVLLTPNQFAFRVALGNAYYALGQYDRAAEQFQAALRINPEAEEVRQFLEMVAARLKSGDSRVA
jgi:tetratricopeptide (TPR) repeat protein